jgi:protein-S-isoprenylcysteine O-methyltransferase Ste14
MHHYTGPSGRIEDIAHQPAKAVSSDSGARRLKESRKFWARWRVRIGYPVAVIYWVLAAPTRQSILIGGIVAALGLLIRGLASGHLRKDERLTTSGPYACTRNPLYLGSALLAAGFVIAGLSWIAGALVAIYFTVFYNAVMRSEESDLRRQFGAAFEEYAARVPLFFPSLGRAKDGESSSPESHFSWAQYLRNREYQALIGTIAGVGSLVLRIWIRGRFGY